ncbi:N-acetylmuramoyl-L-alanine amidase [Virgibacillus salarius]|uniref:N-acetylmuramoyl-L-alanine amidase n=1 Tax=Virgibacillus salarius TaxID=447199 RepID=UPI0031E474DB
MYLRKVRITVCSIMIWLFLTLMVSYADTAIIKGDNVNIRNGPGTNYQTIGQAGTNDTFSIIQRQGEWIQVQLENDTGWIIETYLSIIENNEQSTVDTPPESITIPNDHTQIRNGPSTEYKIAYFAEKGSSFQVISVEGQWYEIQNKNIHGYVYKPLIDKVEVPSSSTFKNKTIVIDAGHGGRDVGAIGSSNIFEKDIAFLTAQELAQELTILGSDVRITRPRDEFVSLGSRVSFSNMVKTDVFISIHYNSVPELPEVTGIESYYYQEANNQLAASIQSELIKATDSKDRGTTHGDFLVLRQNLQASVLVELGFISNPEQESSLRTTIYQKELVSGIVNGLAKYFASK